MKLLMALIIVAISFPFVKAAGLASIGQSIDKGYRLLYVSGNESCYADVALSGTHKSRIDINVRQSANRECVICDARGCSSQRIDPPSNLTVYDKNREIVTSLPLETDHFTFIVLDSLRNVLNFLKFGEQSIIIVGQTSYNSTDTNITQETGFAHLAIDARTNYYFYVPSAVARLVGADAGGNITYTQADDGLTYNTTEIAAIPGLDVRLNFTANQPFDTLRLKTKTISLLGSSFNIDLFNYTSGAFVTLGTLGESTSLTYKTFTLTPSAEFIQNNVSQVRIIDAGLGSALQQLDIDYAELSLANPYRSLKAYYAFDIDNRTIGYDLSNYSVDGAYSGALTKCNEGVFGCAYIDDGSLSLDQRLDLGNPTALFMGTSNFTLTAWVNNNKSQVAGIVKRGTIGSNTAAQQQYMLFINTNGSIQLTVGNQTTSNSVSTFANVSVLRNWLHVTGNVNDTAISIFIDGTLNASTPRTLQGGGAVNNGTVIGARGTGLAGGAIDGMLDEVMFFNESLAPHQIRDIFNNDSSRFQPQGTMLFRNINLQNNNTVNVTIQYNTTFGSNFSMFLNNGSTVRLTNGAYSGYSVPNNLTDANLTLIFEVGNGTDNRFYTPFLFGNITIDSVLITPPVPASNVSSIFPDVPFSNPFMRLGSRYPDSSEVPHMVLGERMLFP